MGLLPPCGGPGLGWLLPHREPAVCIFHLQLVQKTPVSCSGGAELCGALVQAPSFQAAEIQDYRGLRGCLTPPGWPRARAGVEQSQILNYFCTRNSLPPFPTPINRPSLDNSSLALGWSIFQFSLCGGFSLIDSSFHFAEASLSLTFLSQVTGS